MKRLLLTLLLAGALRAQAQGPADATASALAPAATPADELVRDGIGLYDAGRYPEALAKYRQALDLAPASPLARAELAMTYTALDRNAEAAALCQQLVRENPRVSPFVYSVYGRSLDGSRRPAEALAAYRQGIQYFPADFNLHLNEGVALAGQQDYEGAAASFRYAVALRPDQASAHMLLGVTQLHLGARVPGLLALARYLVLEPNSPRSQQRQQWLDQAIMQGVAQQDAHNVTISVPASGLSEQGGRVGDDFGPEELLLALQGAADLQVATHPKTKLDKFIDQFGALCRAMGERQPQAGRGFARTYYAPYFVEMERRGFVPAFAYLAHSAQPNAPEVRQWLAAHPMQVRVFQEWSRSYEWPKLPASTSSASRVSVR